MSRSIALLLALTLTLPALSQEDAPVYGAFIQRLDVSAWQGHRIRITAAARTQCLDADAGASVWARVDNTDKTMGFIFALINHPIRDTGWKVYTITGKLNKKAKTLYAGGMYRHRGYFWFDDFHVYIKTNHFKWTEIPLADAGFEDDTAALRIHWPILVARPFFNVKLTDTTAFEGRYSLLADGATFVKPNTYGDNDTAGHFVMANGIRQYYESYGKGQPLLLLHGNSQSISAFDKQIPELAKHNRVIAVDTRGQGRSGDDGTPYTYDLFARDMDALLDTLQLDSVDVLGWSDGGNTGLIMAMNYPQHVHRLATMGANVFIDNTVVGPEVIEAIQKELKLLHKDTTYSAVNRSRLLTLLLTEPRHTFAELQAIQCLTLVMAGEKDIILPEHTKQIAAHIPHSTLTIFSGGTHYEPADHPDTFNKTVLDFFNTH